MRLALLGLSKSLLDHGHAVAVRVGLLQSPRGQDCVLRVLAGEEVLVSQLIGRVVGRVVVLGGQQFGRDIVGAGRLSGLGCRCFLDLLDLDVGLLPLLPARREDRDHGCDHHGRPEGGRDESEEIESARTDAVADSHEDRHDQDVFADSYSPARHPRPEGREFELGLSDLVRLVSRVICHGYLPFSEVKFGMAGGRQRNYRLAAIPNTPIGKCVENVDSRC